jgi:phage repressor protein C with HTH and peptisase S24 domain
MPFRIHERIRTILETTPGLTQKGLAEKMGLNPAAVNRMLYGRRNIMAEEIPIIESYLGVRLDLSAAGAANIEYEQKNPSARARRRGFSDVPPAPLGEAPVPVYSCAAGGLQQGLSRGDVVDWVARHPAQFGIGNAFAIYVSSDEMEPRYFRGELVYVHPGRPPETGRDCVVEMNSGAVHIRRFLRQDGGSIRIAQFTPPAEKDIPRDDIRAIYPIVGRG